MKIKRIPEKPGEAVGILSRAESDIWTRIGVHPDDLADVRDRCRAKAQAFMAKHKLRRTELFAHLRCGGHKLDDVELEEAES